MHAGYNTIVTNIKVRHIFEINQQNHLKLCMRIDHQIGKHRVLLLP